MKISNFNQNHVEYATKIALENYNEEKNAIKTLPHINNLPDLMPFASNRLGVAAFDNNKMLGFLCCYEPWDNAFNSTAKGTFSPIHANGALLANRDVIYRKMYEAAAKKWVEHKIAYHSIGLYAHDKQAVNALFNYGFGLRCVDAIRPMEPIKCIKCDLISFEKLNNSDVTQIREMRKMLSEHLGQSPCFMHSTPQAFSEKLAIAEKCNTSIFIAKKEGKIIAFIEIASDGENFATEVDSMKNICGAFCLPEFRGTGVFQNLLNYVITMLKAEGYEYLGVDFESFNPSGSRFWLKYFTAYTNGVVRRIDECAL